MQDRRDQPLCRRRRRARRIEFREDTDAATYNTVFRNGNGTYAFFVVFVRVETFLVSVSIPAVPGGGREERREKLSRTLEKRKLIIRGNPSTRGRFEFFLVDSQWYTSDTLVTDKFFSASPGTYTDNTTRARSQPVSYILNNIVAATVLRVHDTLSSTVIERNKSDPTLYINRVYKIHVYVMVYIMMMMMPSIV